MRSSGAKWRFAAGICDGYGVRADGRMTQAMWAELEVKAVKAGDTLYRSAIESGAGVSGLSRTDIRV